MLSSSINWWESLNFLYLLFTFSPQTIETNPLVGSFCCVAVFWFFDVFFDSIFITIVKTIHFEIKIKKKSAELLYLCFCFDFVVTENRTFFLSLQIPALKLKRGHILHVKYEIRDLYAPSRPIRLLIFFEDDNNTKLSWNEKK